MFMVQMKSQGWICNVVAQAYVGKTGYKYCEGVVSCRQYTGTATIELLVWGTTSIQAHIRSGIYDMR